MNLNVQFCLSPAVPRSLWAANPPQKGDRALNCHLNVTDTQETDTLHRAISAIQDQIRKKGPEYTKNTTQNTIHQCWICSYDSRSTHCCHNHELCVSLIWNIQLWAAGQTLLTGRNPQERAEFYEVQLLWISWRSSSVTNTVTKPPKAPISNLYD